MESPSQGSGVCVDGCPADDLVDLSSFFGRRKLLSTVTEQEALAFMGCCGCVPVSAFKCGHPSHASSYGWPRKLVSKRA
eukprot:scaffold86697_cov23-Tisochrysis_lutea.AAC.1